MRSLILGLGLALGSLHTLPSPPPVGVHERAQELLDTKDWEAARDLLRKHLSSTAGDGRAHALLGKALLGLGEMDQAAHHLATARDQFSADGDDRAYKNANRDLRRADPLEGRRARLQQDITKKMLDAAEKLYEHGHGERALTILERTAPIATGKDADDLLRLLEEVRKSFEEVDLDEAGAEQQGGGAWPLVTHESEYYVLKANLEPELVELVAETMDDIHGYYVLLYLDGDEGSIGSKATIRIHPDKKSMLGNWGGGSAPEGWWSPGENQVTCYDTRTSTGTLDWMLETLFHEASHQFMTLLERRGGAAPAWLNEGTSCFFEGAKAMADHRVLWPDAATGRLANLVSMLRGGGNDPSLQKVIGYSGRGSYDGSYYPWGWGIVYFLQQYEDPLTLEYVYRPFYARYREQITSRGGNSMKLFEEVFLGEDSPLGHETLADFDRDWRAWILDHVSPLHRAPEPERRALRLALVERYRAAAEAAAENKKAPVPEQELWNRALGHVEYVRTEIDGEESPDVELIALQADILERQGRKAAAAPLIEQLLKLADEGAWDPSEEEVAALEQRLKQLDRRNYALRRAESTRKALVRTARKLFKDYGETDKPMPMRSYALAARVGTALEDLEVLLPAAADLRLSLRASGVSFGEVRSLVAGTKHWRSIFSSGPDSFSSRDGRLEMSSVRPHARINTSLQVAEEYELRATFERRGELYRSTCHGLVIAATAEGEWLVFGLLKGGKAGLRRLSPTSGDGVTTNNLQNFYLEPRPEDDEDLEVRVRVLADGRIEARVGTCEPVQARIPEDFPRPKYVGIYSKDGTTRLVDPVLENY